MTIGSSLHIQRSLHLESHRRSTILKYMMNGERWSFEFIQGQREWRHRPQMKGFFLIKDFWPMILDWWYRFWRRGWSPQKKELLRSVRMDWLFNKLWLNASDLENWRSSVINPGMVSSASKIDSWASLFHQLSWSRARSMISDVPTPSCGHPLTYSITSGLTESPTIFGKLQLTAILPAVKTNSPRNSCENSFRFAIVWVLDDLDEWSWLSNSLALQKVDLGWRVR